MNDRAIGFILISISIVLIVTLLVVIMPIDNAFRDVCPDKQHKALILSHSLVGVLFAILSLGLYLVFFERGTKAILNRLEEEKNRVIQETHFEVLLSGLDEFERKVMKAVKEQDGVEQRTLRLRVDMSHAKLSLVLKELERRGLLVKQRKGKTYTIYLKNRHCCA